MEDIREVVRQKYADAITRRTGCCSGTQCCDDPFSKATNSITGNLYDSNEVAGLPKDAIANSFGCGNPTALAQLNPGEVVLDLGSGAGLDVLLSARRVGPTGKAYGLDMTDEMLKVARENQAKSGIENAEFLKGHIEDIPLTDNTVDVIISNCVINLSGDKDKVLDEAFRVLKPGGKFAVSDIVLKKPLPSKVQQDLLAWAGCIAGALLEDDYKQKLASAGFENIEVQVTRTYDITCPEAQCMVSNLTEEEHQQLNGAVVSAFVRAVKPCVEKEDSRLYFEEVANKWDTMRQSLFPDSVRDKALEIANVQAGKQAADIGAGTGFITKGLVEKGLSVIAVDQSPAMLEQLKANLSDHGHLVDCRVGTAENLPIVDGSLDYVFANMYLHHVDLPAGVIAEMARVLRPGGLLVITDLDEHNFEFLKTEQFDRWLGFKREDIKNWFTSAGLKNIVVDCVGSNCCSDSGCGCGQAEIGIFVAKGNK